MKRFVRCLAAFVLLLALLAALPLPASADVGNVDWGGGYDDWGGGGYDYDWGGGGDYIFIGDGGSIGGVSVGTVVIVVIAVLVISYLRSKNGSSSTAAQPRQTVRQSGANPITAAEEQAVIDSIRAADPDFAAEQFKTHAGDVILRVQEAWEARDFEVVRPFVSDKLYALHCRQLEEYITTKKTNHLDSQYIEKVTLAAFAADGANEVLTVRVDMSLCDYTTDDATGNILEGVKTMRLVRAYRLEFIRSTGAKTVAGETVKAHSCPHCGAPLDLNAAGRCAYCDSVVTSGQYGWVLNTYNKW